jgi:multidrug efflux system membrane fusion protein
LEAVQRGQNGEYVFVVKQDGTVESREVTVSRADQRDAIIEKGLAPGETVVTDGQLRLQQGAKVQIKGEAGS